MKPRFFVLLLSILILCAACTAFPGSEQQMKFYCTEQTVELPDTGDVQRTVYEYDEQWRTKTVISYENGSEFSRLSYEWSEDNTFCRIIGSGGTPYQEDCTFTYDEMGNILKSVRSEGGVTVSTEAYTYDEKGNVLSFLSTMPQLGSSIRMEYRYDDSGNCVETVSDYGNGLTITTRTTYDQSGRPLSEVSDTYRREYTYQDDERLTVISNYVITGEGKAAEQSSGTTLITHDKYGNEILTEHYNEYGELIMQITAVYVPESD